MPLGFIKDTTLTDIADAIREKKEISALMYPGEMAELIRSIETGTPLPSWISAIDFATATPSTVSTSISVPTVFTSNPSYYLLFASSSSKNGSEQVIVEASYTKQGSAAKVAYASGYVGNPTGVSRSYSSGKVTFSHSSYSFSNDRTYYFIMWR